MMKEKKPEIVVFAGPNGSGKSTYTEILRPLYDYINADEIKKNLKCSDLEAAKIAEEQREKHLANKENFCFETVLSTPRNLELLKRAKKQGYFIRCYYILTASYMINVYRVQSRVQLGGHDVPMDKIKSRYKNCLQLMKEVIAVSDVCHVYDNSFTDPYRIFKKRKDKFYFDECADWPEERIKEYCGVENAEEKNLNLPK